MQLTINPALGTGGGDLDLDYDLGDIDEILYSDLNLSYRWEPGHVKLYRVNSDNYNSKVYTSTL